MRVTARVEPPDNGNGNDNGEGPTPYVIPGSEDQRPGRLCGLGMLMSFVGSLVGLSAVRLARRRLRL